MIKEFPRRRPVPHRLEFSNRRQVDADPLALLRRDRRVPRRRRWPGRPDYTRREASAGPTYSRRKIFLVSTPTIKGVSRIEREFLASDQRRYFVPCPHCDNFDWIRWENIRWVDDDPKTSALLCVACRALIEERFKVQMLARGEWRPTAKSSGETIGFHISSLYSPLGWVPWSAAVSEFLAAKEEPMRLRVNSVLGETWEERGDSVEPEGLMARAERYAADVPNGVGVLVASVDVQGDRLECAVKGYGAGEESWLIAFSQFHGDPGRRWSGRISTSSCCSLSPTRAARR